jgi:hypothetical protein
VERRLLQPPSIVRHRPDLDPAVWTLHIAKPGRNARRPFYEIVDDRVEFYAFFYDGMDLPNAWGDRKDP